MKEINNKNNQIPKKNFQNLAVRFFSYLLIIALFSPFISPEAIAKRQLIWSLSKQQKHSDRILISGVPVSCLIGNSQVKGTYVTRVVKDGPAFKSGIRARDVILKVNDRIMVNARHIDTAVQSLKGKMAQVKFARRSGDRMVVRSFNANWSGLATPFRYTKSKKNKKPRIINRPKGYKENAASIAQLETFLFNLVNKDRRENGNLPPYARSAGLSNLARAYATDQAKRGFTGHRDPEGRMPQDRARQAGINAFVCENVAWCSSESMNHAGKVRYCQDSMMSEPPNQINHRGAILSSEYKYCGVGVGIGKDGKVYVCQEFSSTPVP